MNEDYNKGTSTNIITKDTIEKTGEDGAYFRTLETAKQTFGFDKDEENIYHLVVTFPKGRREEIKTAATAAGESVNGYIKKAVDQRMERESNE